MNKVMFSIYQLSIRSNFNVAEDDAVDGWYVVLRGRIGNMSEYKMYD